MVTQLLQTFPAAHSDAPLGSKPAPPRFFIALGYQGAHPYGSQLERGRGSTTDSRWASHRNTWIQAYRGACLANYVKPFEWLKDVLERLCSHPVNRLEELLPNKRSKPPKSRSEKVETWLVEWLRTSLIPCLEHNRNRPGPHRKGCCLILT